MNLTMLPKKRAVAAGSIFTANMTGNATLGSKVKQFFENIKLKFWDVSKSISKDCANLENVLTDATNEAIRKGNAKHTMEYFFETVGKEINNLLSDKTKVSMYKNEKNNATIEQHLQDVSKLQTKLGVLQKFLQHGDNLNNFKAFYKEPDIDYARLTAAFYGRPFNEEDELQKMESWQREQFKDLESAKAFLNENKEHPLKSVLNEKIAQIEDRVFDDNRIRQFYDDFRDGKIESGKLASKCNVLVKHLKTIEKWLRSADPNSMYEISTNVIKRGPVAENHPKNKDIEENLRTYVNEHPETRIAHYRGIPYIADQSDNPVSIE